MKRILFLTVLSFLGLSSANASQKSIICNLQGMVSTLSFKIPSKQEEYPQLDFPYPVTATIFNLTPSNLLLVAMDEEDSSRLRIVVSTQYNKLNHSFDGQYVTDYGGNQLQIDNGFVSCKVN